MVAAFLAYSLLVVAITFSSRQLVRATFSGVSATDLPLNTLSLVVGIPLFLIVFSLIARLIPAYGLALPATLLTLLFAGRIASGSWGRLRQGLYSTDRATLLFFFALLVPSYLLRMQWPALHWENSFQRLGVERMFNVSMQQAFLRGEGWPANNLWLAGEPIDYHILLRALPGLGGWLTRALSGETMSGGVIYLLNDVFFLALAPTAFAAFALVLIKILYPSAATKKLLAPVICTALFSFATPNAKAIASSFSYLFFHSGLADFWLLQHEVVPHTVSYFPFGLLLSGESHSYAQAPFLSIAWMGLVVLYCSTAKNLPRTIVLGLLAATIAASHAATAIVCALCTLPLFAWDILGPAVRREPSVRTHILHAILLAVVSGLALLPTYLEHIPPQMKVVFVPSHLASALLPFASVHCFSFVVIASVTLCFIIEASRNRTERMRSRRLQATVIVVIALLAIWWNRPVIALSLGLAAGACLLFLKTRTAATLALCGAFFVWVFPEVIVTDWIHDNRTDWIRFNTAMRLWLESTYLIPFAALLVAAPSLESLLQSQRFRRFSAAAVALGLTVVSVSDYVLTERRIYRAPERASIDGFDFLRSEAPHDFQVIQYLSLLPGAVVLGEMCGDGSHEWLPYHYGKPGRISAFSGRPSLCGWARHTWMFQQRLRRSNPANEALWQSFLSYNTHFKNILSSGSPHPLNLFPIEQSLLYLKQRGVTHLVVGELERAIIPEINLATLATMIGGRVMFEPHAGIGVVEMPREIAER
jgi:uncharacterized membrane protein